MLCNQCGASCPDESGFCPICGHKLEGAVAPTPATPKKKNLAWLYVLIFALVVAAATVVLIVAFGGDGDKDEDQPDTPTTSSAATTEATTPASTTTAPTTRPSSVKLNGKYDLGYFDGEYYINEWADLKLKIPTYWEDEGSGTIESINTAIALYRLDEESRGLVQVMLLDRMGERLTPRQMIDLMIMELSSDDEVDFDFDTPSDNVKLASHTGTGVIGRLSAEGETYCCGMYAYEVDDCLIFVHVIGYDRDAMADMMLDFTGV
ncbi:MAG: zinc ribbon domain-containing protein [Clostridia bacterium]|nr:zinc ribbon domain-containing protein [Clostridia bacterium]